MANHSIGSYWRRWDLHIHTPDSFVQHYGSGEQAWEFFLTDLEKLPEEFKVIGINDYLFIDGYRHVLSEKKSGRLINIETIFPVIECRLARFAGTSNWNRINYHIIFSDTLGPDVIEQQFLHQLHGKAKLSPEAENADVDWKGYITKSTIEDLGKAIRASAPPEELFKYNETDFELGMNNINFNPEDILSILDSGAGLSNNYLTAIGKAEWDQLRWNDHSIAEKKNIINSVNAVFSSSANAQAFHRARQRLIGERVNSKLLDCSDAHNLSQSQDKDRIGNCQLWVKADPTFLGLKAALQDYDYRIFVGDEPLVFERIKKEPRHFIRAISFDRENISGSNEKWFEGKRIELNPELVAIIGNRGNGKSALLDCLAFGSYSSYPVDKTSFLSNFRSSKDDKSSDFTVNIEWRGGDDTSVCLASSQSADKSPLAKHLPQHFIDQLCNELGDNFTKELESSIFSHVREDERLGANSLRNLVAKRAHAVNVELEKLTTELKSINMDISNFEAQSHPNYLKHLSSTLSSKMQELKGIIQNRPPHPQEPIQPESAERDKLNSLKINLSKINGKIQIRHERRNNVRECIEAVRRLRSQGKLTKQRIDQIEKDSKRELDLLGIGFDEIVKIEINYGGLDKIEETLSSEMSILESLLDETIEDSLLSTKSKLEQDIGIITNNMTGKSKKYELAIKDWMDTKNSINTLIGSKDIQDHDTIRGLQVLIHYITTELPAELESKYTDRLSICHDLFKEYFKIIDILKELYSPVQEFIDKYEGNQETLGVKFDVKLIEDKFEEQFFNFIARNRKGSFYGASDSSNLISKFLTNIDFNSWPSVENFLNTLIDFLTEDHREGCRGQKRYILDQLKTDYSNEFYDFLFGLDYLNPQYMITLNGKSLQDLSPGEKGALLLVFYLLVDKSRIPLMIDQPEENLDNQSVYGVLRPFIREASSRRQVFLVTHNPNIAVAAGADQIIYCSINKTGNCEVFYESGALENPSIGKHIVNVLEGTKPAFLKRDEKYKLTELGN